MLSRNSTQVVRVRNAGSRLRFSREAPGNSTGITRKLPSEVALRSMAVRISSFCHGPAAEAPKNTAQVSQAASARSISSCQGAPGMIIPLIQPGMDTLFFELLRDRFDK